VKHPLPTNHPHPLHLGLSLLPTSTFDPFNDAFFVRVEWISVWKPKQMFCILPDACLLSVESCLCRLSSVFRLLPSASWARPLLLLSCHISKVRCKFYECPFWAYFLLLLTVIRLNDEKLSREKLSAFGFQLFSFLTAQNGAASN